MIRTYKQWMETMYESVQALHESSGSNVTGIFSTGKEFFLKFWVKNSRGNSTAKAATGDLNNKWSQTANAVSRDFGSKGGDKKFTNTQAQITRLLKFARKTEETSNKKAGLLGTKTEAVKKYARIYCNFPEGENYELDLKHAKHNNAQGGMVQFDNNATGLNATIAGRNKAGMANIYDLLHEINLANLGIATQACSSLANLTSKKYPRAKDIEK